MSEVIFRRTFYMPDNLINDQSFKAALTYSCNGIQGIEYIYCENIETFSVETDNTLDINTIMIDKETIRISPATKFTYFIDKNKILSVSGSFSGTDFHAFLDKENKVLNMYNMPNVVRYYKTESDVFSYTVNSAAVKVFIPNIVGDLIIRSTNGPDVITNSDYFAAVASKDIKRSAKTALDRLSFGNDLHAEYTDDPISFEDTDVSDMRLFKSYAMDSLRENTL